MTMEKLKLGILQELKRLDGLNIDRSKRENYIMAEDFGVSPEQFTGAIRYLSKRKYVVGHMYIGNIVAYTGGMTITKDGEKFLHEKNKKLKTFIALTDAREWLNV